MPDRVGHDEQSHPCGFVMLNEVKHLYVKDPSLTLRMTENDIMLIIKDLNKSLACQGIASIIRKLLKHRALHPSIKQHK